MIQHKQFSTNHVHLLLNPINDSYWIGFQGTTNPVNPDFLNLNLKKNFINGTKKQFMSCNLYVYSKLDLDIIIPNTNKIIYSTRLYDEYEVISKILGTIQQTRYNKF